MSGTPEGAALTDAGRRYAEEYRGTSILARVALEGRENGWPDSHVAAAVRTCNAVAEEMLASQSLVTRPHKWSPSGARCVRTGCNVAGTGDRENDGNCEGTD